MTLERAIRLARSWAFGGVNTLREGEAQEYHKLALEAMLEKLEREDPKPLTLDELRKMDGEPVWCVNGRGQECWCLVSLRSGAGIANTPDCIDSETGLWDGDFYGLYDQEGKRVLHVLGWLAYRHKPKEGAKNEL